MGYFFCIIRFNNVKSFLCSEKHLEKKISKYAFQPKYENQLS